jgi:hypothetical protein
MHMQDPILTEPQQQMLPMSIRLPQHQPVQQTGTLREPPLRTARTHTQAAEHLPMFDGQAVNRMTFRHDRSA